MHPNPIMADDYAQSIEQARQDCIRQRIALGLNPDPDCPVNLVLKPQGSVVPFLRQRDDATFTAPSNVHKLQADESLKVLKLAQALAELAYNRELAELPRKEQATCRYLACHALRMTNQNWQEAALSSAITATKNWMVEDGGDRYVGISDEEAEFSATKIVLRARAAYTGISEGSQALTPGRYLAIVQGRGL